MHPQTIIRTLRAEGWRHVRTQRDPPGIHYPPHTHAMVTAHVILSGGMELTLDGKRHTLKPGDRLDVPASAVHEAWVGSKGCTYVIGE